MSEYVYGHVTVAEAKKFEKYIMIERQIQYTNAVLRRHPGYGIRKLSTILEWKFGECILRDKILREIKGNI